MTSRKCSHVGDKGKKCKAWAIRDSNPPVCAAHRLDGGPGVGAPPNNKNRETHGYYSTPIRELQTIDDIINDLFQRQSQLSGFIEREALQGEVEVNDMAKLLGLLGQNASRIGRLLRDKRALSGDAVDGLLSAIGAALDEISTELGIKL